MELLGLSGYILAGGAYFIFILLIVAARNQTLSGRFVLFSSILVLSSSALSALQIKQGLSLHFILVLENIKLALWSVLILSTQENIRVFKHLFNYKIKKTLGVIGVLSVCGWGAAIFSHSGGKYLFFLFLALNLLVLVLLEQLYRNADIRAKRDLLPLVIGFALNAVFDFVMFAQASMVNQLDFSYWYGRGFIVAISMPFILMGTRRIKDWSVNVFISREVVFYSSLLMISGSYLLLLAMAGYVINYFGGKWGNVISIAFLVLGGAVLAALLITEKLRREVKVFIAKHFFANKYNYRIEWLKSIEKLEIGSNEDYYKTAVDIVASSLGVSMVALVKKVALGQYQCLHHQDMLFTEQSLKQLASADDFCQKYGWIIDVREYSSINNSYPELVLDLAYCREFKIDVIVPIFIGKSLYGFFLLSLPSFNGLLNWEDRDLLSALAKQLSHYLSLNEANEQLAEAKQFDAFNRMSAFLVHDLKNIQAQLALIQSNAKRHRYNPEFIEDVFQTVDSATQRLDKVLSQLRNKKIAEVSKKCVNVNAIIEQVVTQRNLALPKVTIEITGDINFVIEQETLYSVLSHLVQNAQEATPDDGWVKIRVSYLDHYLHIAILDNGCGMSNEFINKRLFKPFDTTKGNAGMGIGVYEAKQFVESLGGSMQVTSFENNGSIFHLSIPSTSAESCADV